MNINEVLNGDFKNFTEDNAVIFLNEMKNRKLFDLSENEIKNVVDFICTVPKKEDCINYLLYIVDEEIYYPGDNRLKKLFSDKRMYALRQDMLDIIEKYDEEKASMDDNLDLFIIYFKLKLRLRKNKLKKKFQKKKSKPTSILDN